MKKYSIFVVMAAMVFGAISCNKAELGDNTPVDNTPTVSDWSFTAEIENPTTKMSAELSGSTYDFTWETGDVVKILYAGGSTTATATVSAGVASFTPAAAIANDIPIWLVYPSTLEASLDGNNLLVPMPGVQKSSAPTGLLVSKAVAGAPSVSFKHPVGYYRFDVNGDGVDVTRLTITSAASNNLTAASLSLSFDGEGVPTATPTSAVASLTVDFDGAGTYFVPVLPGVTPAAGDLTFQFYRGEAKTEKAGAYKHGLALENTRSSIVNWADLPAKATNRYVSTSGDANNNGATASAPWSFLKFKSFMENSTENGNSAREAAALALYDGINIRLAAGTYSPTVKVVPAINITTNVIGADKATTIIDGGSSSNILFDIYAANASGGMITFKNLTIQNFTNTGSEGGAIRIGNSTRVFNILFENCAFSGNKTTASGKSGGVFSVVGAKSVLTLKDCDFSSNTGASCGGVLQATTSSTVTFNSCTFTSNSAVTGGVFSIQGTTGVTCNDCTFTTNSATKYGGSGDHKDVGAGAIVLRTSGDAITLNRCTFDRNTVTGLGGAIAAINNNTTITATDCMFTGNNAGSGWGSAIHVSKNLSCRIYLDGCVFKGNTASSRGVVATNSSACLVYMNRVTFKDNTTANNNAWGVAVQAAGSVVCMNNVTTNGNHCTNASPGNTTVFNADSGWLITNSTIIDEPATALVRDNGTVKTTVCNSILINTTSANNVFVIGKGASYFDDCGHNVLSCDGAYNNATPVASDLCSVTSLTGGAYNEVWNSSNKYGVYSWTNDLSGFTPATQAGVEDAIKSYDIDFSANITGVTHVGNDFYAWLEGIGALGKDGRGEPRGSGNWWPGAYQN